MANQKTKENAGDVVEENPGKRAYVILGSDFRFKGKTYQENSTVLLSEEEYGEEITRIKLKLKED